MKPAAKGWKILRSTRQCSSRQIQPHIRRRSYMNTWSGRAVPPPVGTRQQCRYGCNTCPGGCRRNIPQPAPGAPRNSCQRCGAPARQSLSPLSCISCGMAACRPKPKRLPGAACSRRWQPAPTAGLTFGMHCGTIKTGCRTVFVPYPPAGAVCLPAKPGGETATMKPSLLPAQPVISAAML